MNIIVSFLFCPSTRNLNVAYLDASTRCFLFSFFFFYLVWWHLTLTSLPPQKKTPQHLTPIILSLYGTPVRFVRFLLYLSKLVHTRLIIEQVSKCLSLFCRDAFIIILARTVRRRNRNRILLSRHIAVTWAGPKIVNPMRIYIYITKNCI